MEFRFILIHPINLGSYFHAQRFIQVELNFYFLIPYLKLSFYYPSTTQGKLKINLLKEEDCNLFYANQGSKFKP